MATKNPHLHFLGLPGEIREQIYREVLSTANSRRDLGHGCSEYQFDVDILRANRQIYNEAKRIQEENVFVKITTPWPEAEGHISTEGRVPMLASGENAQRFEAYRLHVSIDTPGVFAGNETHSMIICGDDLVAFTRMWHFSNLNHQGLNRHLRLRLHIQDPYDQERKIPKKLQQSLLMPFGVIKNLDRICIKGPKLLSSIKDALIAAQNLPDLSLEECLERATTLKECGNNALKMGRYCDALQNYVDSFGAMHILVNGRARTVHADTYFMRQLTSGIYKDQRGDYVRLVLRVRLVANTILAYLKLQEWDEAHFWGKRSIMLFRQARNDQAHSDNGDAEGLWLGWKEDEQVGRVPAASEVGKIYYRTALASRELGKAGEAAKLIQIAALYLPDDKGVHREKSLILNSG